MAHNPAAQPRRRAPKISYELRPGFRLSGSVAVGTLAHEIESLKAANPGGEITAPEVLDYARSKVSPIHKLFDWNDKTAAEKHRLEQARYFIRCYVVVRETRSETTRTLGNINVSTTDTRVYVSADAAMDDPQLREIVVADLVRAIRGIRMRARFIPNIPTFLMEALDAAIQKYRDEEEKHGREVPF